MIDYDSFGPYWILINQDFSILSTSSSFKDVGWSNLPLWSQVKVRQPTIIEDYPTLEQLYDRIIIIKFATINHKFRCTLHKVDDRLLLLASPIISSIDKMKELKISKSMSHPACMVMDLLILKDVIAKGQEKVRHLENKSIKAELDEQKKINQHQAKLASLGELYAGVAHEVNNPLTIATGNLALCRRAFSKGNPNIEDINRYFNKQDIALERITKIVNSLKLHARSDEDVVEEFSLITNISEVFYLLEELYKKEGISLIFDKPNKDFIIVGVPGEFQQVILNLIKNAKDGLKNTKVKNIVLSINQRPLHQLTVTVVDNGNGIPEEIREKIFDPFFTSKPVGEGTGLGLGICNDIIKKMGGNLYFHSIIGVSTTFLIDLPYRSDSKRYK
jgi:signal transduction histidine kinase